MTNSDEAGWQSMSSADAHASIREYWPEIEHGNDWLLQEALDGFGEHLSQKAIAFINTRLESQT